MRYRRGLLFGSALVAALMSLGSAAFACMTFLGQMTVDGHDGDTTVVGYGQLGGHRYCSTGQPTTAAAGHLEDEVTITVAPGSCADEGAVIDHQLPDKTYEVRYTNKKSYTFGGTHWTHIGGTGCYLGHQAGTTSIPGTLDVVGGSGSWTGQLGTLAGIPYYALLPIDASHFCVYDPTEHKGLMAPYRLLLI